jgi:hypothetical protein
LFSQAESPGPVTRSQLVFNTTSTPKYSYEEEKDGCEKETHSKEGKELN